LLPLCSGAKRVCPYQRAFCSSQHALARTGELHLAPLLLPGTDLHPGDLMCTQPAAAGENGPCTCSAAFRATRRFGPLGDGYLRRHGVRTLLVSKFIMGFDAVAAPLTGASESPLPGSFFDAAATLWSAFYAVLGYVFSTQLEPRRCPSDEDGTVLAPSLPPLWPSISQDGRRAGSGLSGNSPRKNSPKNSTGD